MDKTNQKSFELWEKYGEHLLLAMPYADGLIAEARGATITDIDGNQMLDLAAGQFCSIVGHNHPRLIKAITEQTQRVLHTGTQFLSPVVLEAAAKFAEVAPGNLNKSIFLSTGTEANECAIAIAKMCTRKTGVVGFSRGYYGLSLATKSLCSIHSRRERYASAPKVTETYSLLTPHCSRCPIHNHYPECNLLCLETSIEASMPDPDNLAAIIVEPVVSAGGMIIPPPGYLQALKRFAEEHEALLIVDEAQTGFGRTGKWFAIEHHGVEPDILVVSKSAGGGFPVSGLITSDGVAERVVSEGFVHLASHQSDPVAASAVAALIDIVRDEGLVQKAAQDGEYFMDRLRELQRKHSIVRDVRGQGLMIGMELSDESDGAANYDLGMAVAGLCARSGVHLTYTYFEPVLRFIPPITIARQEIDRAILILDKALADAARKDISVSELFPTNRFTRHYVEQLSGKRTVKRIFSTLYETSPQFWMKKLSEAVRK